MGCAQVAVRPLEEVCFPHYILILLEDQDTDRSVRRFGTIVARLVHRALKGDEGRRAGCERNRVKPATHSVADLARLAQHTSAKVTSRNIP